MVDQWSTEVDSDIFGADVETPTDLLAEVAGREVAFKQYIADRGYLHFSAFDYPSGALDEEIMRKSGGRSCFMPFSAA